MNLAHIHLVLNHIPVVGIPLALAFLLYGTIAKNRGAQKFAFFALVAVAAITLPTYFTGEPAEEVVENLPGVTEPLIEAHEEAAELALILTSLTGISAIAALVLARKENLYRYALYGTILAAVLAAGSLGYTANLGGQIRHTEIRANAAAAPAEAPLSAEED